MAESSTDRTSHRLVIRLVALVAVALTLAATVVLSTVIGPVAAAIGSFLLVGPAVHLVAGRVVRRQSEQVDHCADLVVVAALAYPLVLWLGGALYVGLTRSLALGVVVAVAPLMLVVLAAVLWNP